jgi:hypothetical protein
MRRPLVLFIAALIALGACSGKKKSNTPSAAASGTPKTATQPTIPPATATTNQVTTPDGNKYTVTITPATTGNSGCGTQTPLAGRYSVPFTVVQKNDGTKPAPEYRMRFDIDDPAPSANGQEVVAIKLVNTCVDYTAPGNTLDAGGTVTYSGVANNISTQAKLKVTVIGTPNSEPLGTVEGPLAAGK